MPVLSMMKQGYIIQQFVGAGRVDELIRN